MPDSSRFARVANLTLRVMGGKSGNDLARNGNAVLPSFAGRRQPTPKYLLPRQGRGRPSEMRAGWQRMAERRDGEQRAVCGWKGAAKIELAFYTIRYGRVGIK